MSHQTLLLTTLTACGIMLLSTSCKEKQETTVAKAPEITVFPLVQQAVEENSTWFSFTAGADATPIVPQVQGYIASQEYENGTQVKKGDVLFRIDAELFQAQVNQAKANLAEAQASKESAKASVDQSELDVKRFTGLVAQGAAPEKDLIDAKESLNAAQAALEKSDASIALTKAALESAQINLDYCTITAPYDGLAGTANVSVGELVDSSKVLVNLVSINPMDLDLSVSSDLILSDFSRGDGLSKTTTPPLFDITLEDGSIYPLKGRIRTIDSLVDQNGTVHLKGRVDNPNHKLLPGLSVRASIPTKAYDALLVSPTAIQETLRNKFVIALDPSNKPIMVPVQIMGSFDVEVSEANGYKSTQSMLSIAGIDKSLEESFKALGYDKPTDAPIVTDATNGMLAASISANNSRLDTESGQTAGTVTPISFTFKPAPSMVQAKMKEKQDEAGQTASTPQTASLPPMPVTVMNLIQQDIGIKEEWQGYLRGVEETQIRAKVTGFLQEQVFTDGGMVQAGDVLFQLDPAPFKAALDQAEANLSVAKAATKQAEANYSKATQDVEIYEKLNKSTPGAVAEKTLTDAITAVETTRAALQQAQASILQMQAQRDTAAINLSYTTIKAPFTGITTISNPSKGQLIKANDPTPLVTISSVNPIRVDFSVSGRTALDRLTKESQHLSQGQEKEDFRLKNFDIILENGKTYPQEGNFISADNVVDTNTGTISVVGHIPNEDGFLVSGMPVRVQTETSVEKDSFIVPARAPITVGTNDMIVLMGEDQAPTLLPIKKGSTALVKVTEADGSVVEQPMQAIEVDDELLTGLLLSTEKADNLEEIIFKLEDVDSWSALAAKKAGSDDFKALIQKMNEKGTSDQQVDENQDTDWETLFYNRNGAKDAKHYVFNQSGASSEGEYITKLKGYNSPLTYALEVAGFKDLSKVQLVVEGAIAAMRTFQANDAGKTRANKLSPTPFKYSQPKTVVKSITAEK